MVGTRSQVMAYEKIESFEKRMDEFQGNMEKIASQLSHLTNMR